MLIITKMQVLIVDGNSILSNAKKMHSELEISEDTWGTLKASLVYPNGQANNAIRELEKDGTYTVEFGPQGNAPGNPRHVQRYALADKDFAVNYCERLISFDLVFVGIDKPSINMFEGGSY